MQRLSPRYRSQQVMRRNPSLQRFLWRRHVGAHPDGLQHGGREPTETSVTEFCYKNVNLSLEELKNIKIILFLLHRPYSPRGDIGNKSFLLHELFGQPNSPNYVGFVNQHGKCHVTRKLRNSSVVYYKTKNPFLAKICMNSSFQLLLFIMKVKSQEDQ